jgi:hypothetical protein
MYFRIALLAFACLFSVPAFADDCGGKLIDLRNIYTAGSSPKKIGELQLYYNGSNGKNCVKTVHSAATWGKSLRTAAALGICKNRDDRRCNHPDYPESDPRKYEFDVDWYKFEAGPVRLAAGGKCIRAAGYIIYQGKRRNAKTIYGHCG